MDADKAPVLKTLLEAVKLALGRAPSATVHAWARFCAWDLDVLLKFVAENADGILQFASMLVNAAAEPDLRRSIADAAAFSDAVAIEVQRQTQVLEASKAAALDAFWQVLPASSAAREAAVQDKVAALEAERRALESEARAAAARAAALETQSVAAETAFQQQLLFMKAQAVQAAEGECARVREAARAEKERLQDLFASEKERLRDAQRADAAAQDAHARHARELLELDLKRTRDALAIEKAETERVKKVLEERDRAASAAAAAKATTSYSMGVVGEAEVNEVLRAAVGDAAELVVNRTEANECDATLRFLNAAASLLPRALEPSQLCAAPAAPAPQLLDADGDGRETHEPCADDGRAEDAKQLCDTVTALPRSAVLAALQGGDLCLKIETKNRDEVRSNQVTKFEDEVAQSAAHGGVLISLRCTAFGCAEGVLDLRRLKDGRPILILNNFRLFAPDKRVPFMRQVLKIALDLAKLAFFDSQLFLEHEESLHAQITELNAELCDLQVARYSAQTIDRVLDARFKAAMHKLEVLRQNTTSAATAAKRAGLAAKEAALLQAHAQTVKDVLAVFSVDAHAVRTVQAKILQPLLLQAQAYAQAPSSTHAQPSPQPRLQLQMQLQVPDESSDAARAPHDRDTLAQDKGPSTQAHKRARTTWASGSAHTPLSVS